MIMCIYVCSPYRTFGFRDFQNKEQDEGSDVEIASKHVGVENKHVTRKIERIGTGSFRRGCRER